MDVFSGEWAGRMEGPRKTKGDVDASICSGQSFRIALGSQRCEVDGAKAFPSADCARPKEVNLEGTLPADRCRLQHKVKHPVLAIHSLLRFCTDHSRVLCRKRKFAAAALPPRQTCLPNKGTVVCDGVFVVPLTSSEADR